MDSSMTPFGYPPDLYHCLLDEQPYYLVPSRLFGEGASRPLIVNPHCWFSWHGPLPSDKAMRISGAEYFYPTEWVVWVDDPGTHAVWPYWVSSEYYSYLENLAPGYSLDSELPAHAEWVLTRARILVEPNYIERRRKRWFDTVWNCATDFQRGYASVSDLVPQFHLGALRRYYRYHTRVGSFPLGDDQVSRRYAAHNENVARYFHRQLAPAIGDIARTLIKPSYCYSVAYQSGSTLERHTDREQCEYSATLCIDASPEPRDQSPWPIYLDVRDGALRIWQYIGDALLYRGRYLTHYRDELPQGHTSTSLLFHYVDEDFAGALE
jgi:hypothetical protein